MGVVHVTMKKAYGLENSSVKRKRKWGGMKVNRIKSVVGKIGGSWEDPGPSRCARLSFRRT